MNGGGAVGASDLLTAPSEIFVIDMSEPVTHLAQQVLVLYSLQHHMLQYACVKQPAASIDLTRMLSTALCSDKLFLA